MSEQFTQIVTLDDGLELEVEFTYWPFCRGQLEGGMKISPDEPESFEIECISIDQGGPDDKRSYDIDHLLNYDTLQRIERQLYHPEH